jgi:hypothetical protein
VAGNQIDTDSEESLSSTLKRHMRKRRSTYSRQWRMIKSNGDIGQYAQSRTGCLELPDAIAVMSGSAST